MRLLRDNLLNNIRNSKNMEFKKRALWILLAALFSVFILSHCVFSQNSHIKLLAVSEDELGNEKGQVVDLYLEVYPGQGRVFIDSYPLTKLDTQVSTRFANRFACDYANVDCSKIDFIYTIRSNSPIIGGPSASAAIAALTIAKLTNSHINESVALTGTLNSGGIIGEVGGVKNKILAAKNAGINIVLIPKGTWNEEIIGDVLSNVADINADIEIDDNENITDDDNVISDGDNIDYEEIADDPKIISDEENNDINRTVITTAISDKNITALDKNITANKIFNWSFFEQQQNIGIKEVISITDVLNGFGVEYEKKHSETNEIDKYYIDTMKSLAEDLCNDAKENQCFLIVIIMSIKKGLTFWKEEIYCMMMKCIIQAHHSVLFLFQNSGIMILKIRVILYKN